MLNDINDDVNLLGMAYERKAPFVVGETMYIPGTRSIGDVIADALIPLGMLRYSKPYYEAAKLYNPGVKVFVGHSLGAAVAAELAKNLGGVSVGYGSPVKNSVNYADPRDVVPFTSLLTEGRLNHHVELSNSQPYLHHSMGSYASHVGG